MTSPPAVPASADMFLPADGSARTDPPSHNTPTLTPAPAETLGTVDLSLLDGVHGSSCILRTDESTAADGTPAPRPGDEPLPGYRLVERLGTGGYGEVWRCTAPGGLPKAIKFVRCRRAGLDLDDGAARQEAAAFEQVRAIRHPFVLGLDRFERRGGEVLAVMELADQTLQDRLDERRRGGCAGVPAAELLPLLAEAAEALDLLAGLGLQHLDVKPANLFLVGGHAKVGDFGLIAPVGPREGGGEAGAGVTPRYAPPEVLRGEVAAVSDQYSLALTAYELLTGCFPYPPASTGAVLVMHLTGRPDLSAVGGAAARVFARALAKRPGDRFPSCREFVTRLAASLARDPSPAGDGGRDEPEPARPAGAAARSPVDLPAAAPPVLVFAADGRAEPGPCPVPAGKVVRAMIRHCLLAVTRVAAADATGQTDVTRLFLRFPVRSGLDALAARVAEFAANHGLGMVAATGGEEFVLTAAREGGWLTRLLDRGPPVEVVVSLPGTDPGEDGTREVAVLARGCGGAGGRVDRGRYAAALSLLHRVRDALVEGDDRRHWTRYPVDVPVVLYQVRPDGSVWPGVPGRCVDLSQGGCSLHVPNGLTASAGLYVRFPGHPSTAHVGVRCAVVRRSEVDGGVELGCEFPAEPESASTDQGQ